MLILVRASLIGLMIVQGLKCLVIAHIEASVITVRLSNALGRLFDCFQFGVESGLGRCLLEDRFWDWLDKLGNIDVVVWTQRQIVALIS